MAASSSYSGEDWYAVVTPTGIALLPQGTAPSLVESVWSALREGRGFPGLLDELTGAFGTSLASFPSFAVASFSENETRIAVRGPLSVEVVDATSDTPVVVSGVGVTTWNERALAAPQSVQLALAEGANSVDGSAVLPIVDGVVRASRVTWSASGDRELAGAATRQDSQSSVAEEPEPDAPMPSALELTSDLSATRLPELEPSDNEPAAEPSVSDDYDDLWGATIATSVESAAVRESVAVDVDEKPAVTVPPPRPAVPAALEPVAAAEPAPVAAGSTMISSVPGVRGDERTAAVPVATERAAVEQSAVEQDDDHDGETIAIDQLRVLTGQSGSVAEVRTTEPPALMSRGRIVLSTGDEFDLDRPVIIGRRPRASRVSGAEMPHLVTVPSPLQDISRSHVEIRLEGTHVLIEDLNTTNGTTLLRPGDSPLRLHPNEPTLAASGDVIDLGEGITLTFLELV